MTFVVEQKEGEAHEADEHRSVPAFSNTRIVIFEHKIHHFKCKIHRALKQPVASPRTLSYLNKVVLGDSFDYLVLNVY